MEDFEALRVSIGVLSRFFVGEETLERTLQRVVELAHAAIPGADLVGITMLDDRGRPSTTVFTDGEASEIDQAQYRAGTGPCLDAYRTGRPMRIEAVDSETRWPDFVDSARQHGIGSTLSMPLVARSESMGALNIYSRRPRAFDEAAEETGASFAAHAAVPIANAHAYWVSFNLAANLNQAMESRASIEQAKGLIMGQLGVSPDVAFELLRTRSQTLNVKLRDIAAQVVAERRFRVPVDGAEGSVR
jgi:GAF domain-containing protein